MGTREKIKQELDRELIVRLFAARIEELDCYSGLLDEIKNKTPEEFFNETKRGDILLYFFYEEKGTKGFPPLEKIKLVEIECINLIIHLMKYQGSKNAIKVTKQYILGKIQEEELEEAHEWACKVYHDFDCGERFQYNHELYEVTIADLARNVSDIDNYFYNDQNHVICDVVEAARESPFMSGKKVMKHCTDICKKRLWIPKDYLNH